jgi:hypothetical protein
MRSSGINRVANHGRSRWQANVYRSAREAVRKARTALPQGLPIRVGLTGLTAESTSAAEAMFTPCPNISMAARQITQLVDRCKTVPSFKADPVHCAIAAYRGSWDHPDNKFADAVATSAVNGDAPNFDMPDTTDVGSGELVVSTLPRRPQVPLTISSEVGRVHCFRRGRSSSAMFRRAPVRALRMQIACKSRASRVRIRGPKECVTMVFSCPDCLSGGRNDRFEHGSHDFAWCRAFGSEDWERRPPDRAMAR